jgi:hypothetical protein
MAGEESMPVMVAPGKREARREVLFPGPQPRSTMRDGEYSGPRKVSKSWIGRLRALRKRRYWSGDQSSFLVFGCEVDMVAVN